MPRTPYSLLIVDDNAWLVGVVSSFLASQRPGGLTVVGTARNSSEAVTLAAELRPEVILLDIGLGTENGLALIPRIGGPATSIVVFSLKNMSIYEPAALAAGEEAFVSKVSLATELWPAIERVVTARLALAERMA